MKQFSRRDHGDKVKLYRFTITLGQVIKGAVQEHSRFFIIHHITYNSTLLVSKLHKHWCETGKFGSQRSRCVLPSSIAVIFLKTLELSMKLLSYLGNQIMKNTFPIVKIIFSLAVNRIASKENVLKNTSSESWWIVQTGEGKDSTSSHFPVTYSRGERDFPCSNPNDTDDLVDGLPHQKIHVGKGRISLLSSDNNIFFRQKIVVFFSK